MELVQALHSGWCGRPARAEHGSGARFGRLERGRTAAMEQAGIVEAAHNGHERIESSAVFRNPAVARRVERRQADSDHMREGRPRLAAGARGAIFQSDLLAVAQRTGCEPIRESRERGRGRRRCDAGGVSLRRTLGGSGG
jgi:hypothetical protein